MRTLLLLAGLLLSACTSAPPPKSETELHNLFGTYFMQQHSRLKTGKHLVFIINKIDCSPCIEALDTMLRAVYPAPKYAVLFDYDAPAIPDLRLLEEDAKTVASYGLLTPKGVACVFRRGKLTRIFHLDTEAPEKSIAAIREAL